MRTRHGFTLLELLAVLFLTGLVLWVATDFYVAFARATEAAADRTRGARRATAILDRVARELQGAVLLTKPPEADPLDHPWLFLAESGDGELGADRLKFVTRAARRRAGDEHVSDLAFVAYALRPAESGEDFELMRWHSPQLPESLDRRIPVEEDDGAELLADGVTAFGVRLLDEQGRWVSTWDSSTLVQSGKLPLAAEIRVAVRADPGAGSDLETEDPPLYARRVRIPMRPVDLGALLEAEAAAGGEPEEEAEQAASEEGCRTVAECVDTGLVVESLGAEAGQILGSLASECFSDREAEIRGLLGATLPEAILCE